ncbi:MAG: 30S ribosomal protein S8e [Candidatus Aenigmatarchaeota archaeon]
MPKWNLKSKRKTTGGLMKKIRKKKKRDRGSEFLATRISKKTTKIVRGRGGNEKRKLLSVEKVNLVDKKTKKSHVTNILSVESNPANIHYVRRNVVTKGAIVKTELGSVRITSRPGQHGVVNGVLVETKK